MTNRESSRETAWTRRGMIAGCIGVLAGLWLLVTGRWYRGEAGPSDSLAGVLRHPEAAARVGGRVLAQLPAWNDAESLRRALQRGLDGEGSLAQQLARNIRSDFEAGRVVRVDGWMLGSTEARVYALAALAR